MTEALIIEDPAPREPTDADRAIVARSLAAEDAQAEAKRIGEIAVPAALTIQTKAIRLMELREATVRHVNRIRQETARPMRKVRRLNLESATRRLLRGAKGLR